MIGLVDSEMFDFMSSIDLKDTLVVFMSDHGLHYGPYFQSHLGERERAQPLLSIHIPEAYSNQMNVLQKNADMWSTPFDLYETVVDIALGEQSNPISLGNSLIRPLPLTRNECIKVEGVSSEYCTIVNEEVPQSMCSDIPLPPTPLSFFADIADNNNLQFSPDRKKFANDRSPSLKQGVFNKSCQCATDRKHWYPCKEHPWKIEESLSSVSVVACIKEDGLEYIDVDIRIENPSTKKKAFIRNSRIQSDSSALSNFADTVQRTDRSLLCMDSLLSMYQHKSEPKLFLQYR